MSQFRGVRSSRFRHVYGRPSRRENCYENVKITQDTHDSNCCAVNTKFLAIITQVAGGGAFQVLDLNRTGRQDHLGVFKVLGHKGAVLDIKWSPFDDYMIASTSEDCSVKVWRIPEVLLGSLDRWEADLLGHTRRTTYVEWHPTARDILASTGFDHLILLWDVSKSVVLTRIACHQDAIYSMAFNYNGSRLVTTCRDKKLRVFDPRTGKILKEGQSHAGSKPSKATYLDQSGKILTTGFSRQSDRQYAVWTDENLEKPLKMETIDSSSGTLFVYNDPDTRIVYIAGKGDGNIRYYEVVDREPWIHYLGQYMTGMPQRGLGLLPKRGCSVQECEITRFYKLHASRDLCEPVSMIVPRKDNQSFHQDIYPDTAAPVPALSAEQWVSGIYKDPIMMSMKDGKILKPSESTGRIQEPKTEVPVHKVEKLDENEKPRNPEAIGTSRHIPAERVPTPAPKPEEPKEIPLSPREVQKALKDESKAPSGAGDRAESGYEDLDEEDPTTSDIEVSKNEENNLLELFSTKSKITKKSVKEMIDLLEKSKTNAKATRIKMADDPTNKMADAVDSKISKTNKKNGVKTQQQRLARSQRSMTQSVLITPSTGPIIKPSLEKEVQIIEKPLTYDELKNVNEAQRAEIACLKLELANKDRKIRELEARLKSYEQKH